MARGHRYGVARGYGVRRYGYSGYRRYGYGGYSRYGYRGYGYRGYRPGAGARCGAQGTFAVSGSIETPNALGGGGLRVAPPLFGGPSFWMPIWMIPVVLFSMFN